MAKIYPQGTNYPEQYYPPTLSNTIPGRLLSSRVKRVAQVSIEQEMNNAPYTTAQSFWANRGIVRKPQGG